MPRKTTQTDTSVDAQNDKLTKVGTPSQADADKRIVEINISRSNLGIAGTPEVGHGFLVKVKSINGPWIKDVLFIVNRLNTAICRNWPHGVSTPLHKEPVMVEMTANSTESAYFAVVR